MNYEFLSSEFERLLLEKFDQLLAQQAQIIALLRSGPDSARCTCAYSPTREDHDLDCPRSF